MSNIVITPRNSKKERHGYWNIKYDAGGMYYKGNFINGVHEGYHQFKTHIKTYYIL